MGAPGEYSFAYSANLSTSLTYTLPTPNPESGMLVLVSTVGTSAVGSDSIANFTKIATATNGGGERIAVYKGTALGGGTDVITATGGGLIAREGYVVCVANWDGVLANVGYVATTTNSLNPPSLDMLAARDHLFYAFARADNTITAGPTGFTNFHQTLTSNRSHAIASQATSAVQTNDPAAFTATVSAAIAGTIGIRPGSAGQAPGGRPSAFLPFFGVPGHHHEPHDGLALRRGRRRKELIVPRTALTPGY